MPSRNWSSPCMRVLGRLWWWIWLSFVVLPMALMSSLYLREKGWGLVGARWWQMV
jgi:hypothetical protein